jgi:hypothetical protein
MIFFALLCATLNPDQPPNVMINIPGQVRMPTKVKAISNPWLDSLRSGTVFWDFEGSPGGFSDTVDYGWLWYQPWDCIPAHSGNLVWEQRGGGNYEPHANFRLDSPFLTLDSVGACTLSFYHWFLIHAPDDGGNLKVSTDSGQTWSIIYPLPPAKYPCDSADPGNAGIPNEPCYSGDSSVMGWHQAVFLLDAYRGQTILVRWHFGSDYSDEGIGWFIDDVRVTHVTHATGIARDAGARHIIRPDTAVVPNATVIPQVRFRNYGMQVETLQVGLRIDSSGINVYDRQLTAVVPAYAESTLNFSPWRAGGTEGLAYDEAAFTVSDSDQYHANDTVRSIAKITSRFWEVLPAAVPIASSGHSLVNRDDGTYMVFGLHTPTCYLDTTLIYFILDDLWLPGPKNPFGPASYGTAEDVRGRFYRIGGTCDFPTPLDRLDIYDPLNNQWFAGAPSPIPMIDFASGVYHDSLIFTFGNGNWGYPPSNQVSFYDPVTNTWHSATSFPGEGRGACAAGVFDTLAVVACGFITSGPYGNDYLIGRINPADPTDIQWGSWQTIPGMNGPRYRVPYGIDPEIRELWLVGGKINGVETDEVWSYSPQTDTWTNWLQPKPTPVSNVAPLAITRTKYGDLGIFVPGGYCASTYLTEHDLFHSGYRSVGEEGLSRESMAYTAVIVVPNPAHCYTAITYTTSCTGQTSVRIYDAAGRLIRTLIRRINEPAGRKTVFWNGQDVNGILVAGGIYFASVQIGGVTKSTKFIWVR